MRLCLDEMRPIAGDMGQGLGTNSRRPLSVTWMPVGVKEFQWVHFAGRRAVLILSVWSHLGLLHDFSRQDLRSAVGKRFFRA